MGETALEQFESIDMLQLLENDYDVRLVESDRQTYFVDTPEDHEKVEAMMAGDKLFTEYRDNVEE